MREFNQASRRFPLGNFIRFQQRDDGSFSANYIPAEGGISNHWQSLYYPGEAALGLLMLYEIDLSPLWLESVAKALTYLAINRAGQERVPAERWAEIATDELLSIDETRAIPASREILIRHTVQICEAILAG